MPDTLTPEELREYREDHSEHRAGPEGTYCNECDYEVPCPTMRLLAHLDALTAAAREFFGGGRWQYHDEYAHVLLVELDKLHDALLPDEEPHDA